MNVPVLSFFTGGGLLDLGLEQAGFSVVWSNEFNPAIADLYEHGMTSWRASRVQTGAPARISSRADILKLDPVSVLADAFPDGQPPLYGMVGGPPCPDFSRGGHHNGHRGDNGRLTATFADMILTIRPDFFVVENVAGLYTCRKHRQFLDRLLRCFRQTGGYLVDAVILNALELGIPQHRERLFVVGIRQELAAISLNREPAVNDTGWFPWPALPAYTGAARLRWPATCRFGETPDKPAHIPAELTVHSVLVDNGDPEALPNGTEYFRSLSDKFWQRDEGDVSSKSFKRLHRYRYSPTAWYGNQEVHLHPWKPRRLSVREALRLQTVPDEYILPPGRNLSTKFRLICNGVPSRMAELLGTELRRFLAAAGCKVT